MRPGEVQAGLHQGRAHPLSDGVLLGIQLHDLDGIGPTQPRRRLCQPHRRVSRGLISEVSQQKDSAGRPNLRHLFFPRELFIQENAQFAAADVDV